MENWRVNILVNQVTISSSYNQIQGMVADDANVD